MPLHISFVSTLHPSGKRVVTRVQHCAAPRPSCAYALARVRAIGYHVHNPGVHQHLAYASGSDMMVANYRSIFVAISLCTCTAINQSTSQLKRCAETASSQINNSESCYAGMYVLTKRIVRHNSCVTLLTDGCVL